MKKFTLLLALSFVIVCGVQAQELKAGLKVGLNFPSASAFGLDDINVGNANDKASGYLVGAFASFKFASFAVQPEALYSFTRFTTVNSNNLDLTYINIPVMLKFYPLPVVGLNVQAGPQFGLLAGSVGRINSQNAQDTLKDSDLSIAVGLGFDAPFGLDVTARYVIGVSDNNDVSAISESIKNTTFQLSIGYALLKKG